MGHCIKTDISSDQNCSSALELSHLTDGSACLFLLFGSALCLNGPLILN